MASTIDLCNSALTLLGQPTISSLSDNNRIAKLANQRYYYCIDAALRAHPWKCALERKDLVADSTAPAFGYDYRFALPTLPWCLRALEMQDKDYIFKIEGRYLLTDESEASIKYIARIAVGSMDSLLFEAVAARIAADLAFPLTNSTSLADQAWRAYKDKLNEAQDIDSQEGSSDEIEAYTWLNSRR
jgi:hypothetical protein